MFLIRFNLQATPDIWKYNIKEIVHLNQSNMVDKYYL